METTYPDLTVRDCEAHDMINKGFCFPCAFGHTEDVSEEFFDDEEVRGGCEGVVEREYRTGAFEAVAGEMELGHCVDWVQSGLVPTVREMFVTRWEGIEEGHIRFWRCIFTVGPLGALLIHMYKSFPLRASKNRTLLQLYSSASSLSW